MAEGPASTETARLTVDLSVIAENWRRLAGFASASETGAVVKADAYGMGAGPIAKALWAAGCRTFFVVFPQEGVALRSHLPDARILVLAGLSGETAADFLAERLTPMLNSEKERQVWLAAGSAADGPLPCGLNFDTGMNRLGFEPGDAARLAADREGVEVVLIASHLACADDAGHPMNRQQLAAFTGIASYFPGVRRSLANSPGIFLGADYHFDLTRPGISLHGGEAMSAGGNPMHPAATFEAKILQIRPACAGETIGYGARQTLLRDSRIAICGAGYADGIMRSTSGASDRTGPTSRAWTCGHFVPILGRVSMDLVAVDITDVPDEAVREGDWVEFFGPHVALDDFARAAGTIGYEILTGIGPRVVRRYRNNPDA
jgi:alanine racemase